MNELDKFKIQILRTARLSLQMHTHRYTCYAITDAMKGMLIENPLNKHTLIRVAARQLKDYIHNSLGCWSFYDNWLAAYSRAFRDLRNNNQDDEADDAARAGRLAWIDYMIAKLQDPT